jgi:hypothetical protein
VVTKIKKTFIIVGRIVPTVIWNISWSFNSKPVFTLFAIFLVKVQHSVVRTQGRKDEPITFFFFSGPTS